MPGGKAHDRPLVARVAELAAVADLLTQAAGGRSGALLVSGEAGVGKTALVREASRAAADRFGVLWASCLPLTSLAVPFLPLTTGLREWTAGGGAAPPASLDPLAFDAWLDQTCRVRPVMLVVDDLQWADQSTLDVLMCVTALPPRRRLAVVATQRTGEAGPGHPLHRWLADARRLPGFADLGLDRLDRAGTAEQLTGLLGTQGNAYLTVLLSRGLDPDADGIPADLPSGLRDAVTRAWHGVSPSARRLADLVAVAGRPVDVDLLAELDPGADVAAAPREAVDAGVLQLVPGDRYWFAHPLLAEVLEAGMLPAERRSRHTAFARRARATRRRNHRHRRPPPPRRQRRPGLSVGPARRQSGRGRGRRDRGLATAAAGARPGAGGAGRRP
jgi:hypothetical protein